MVGLPLSWCSNSCDPYPCPTWIGRFFYPYCLNETLTSLCQIISRDSNLTLTSDIVNLEKGKIRVGGGVGEVQGHGNVWQRSAKITDANKNGLSLAFDKPMQHFPTPRPTVRGRRAKIFHTSTLIYPTTFTTEELISENYLFTSEGSIFFLKRKKKQGTQCVAVLERF